VTLENEARQETRHSELKKTLDAIDTATSAQGDWISTVNASFGFRSLSAIPLLQKAEMHQLEDTLEDSIWIPDKAAFICMVCKMSEFSVFIRKHHCRQCGRVICWKCSKFRDIDALRKNETQSIISPSFIRICIDCNDYLLHSLSIIVV
jgi:hypothetical protein